MLGLVCLTAPSKNTLQKETKYPSKFKKLGSRVSIDIFDTSDINAAIMELKEIEREFESLLKNIDAGTEK